VVALGDPLREHRLVDHELADEVGEAIDAVEIDADGGLGGYGDAG
jgi:hypothetical protein